MNFQHYHPAAHIGLFSVDTHARLRERRVYMRDRDRTIDVPIKAESLAGEKGFYRCEHVDDQWQPLEGGLPKAIDHVCSSSSPELDAWLRVAAFVSDLFVRGPDFERRMVARHPERPKPTDADLHAISHYRTRERYLNIPCVLRAEWFIQEAPAGHRYITSDRGYAVVKWADGRHGYVIPLTPTRLLKVRRTDVDQASLVYDGRNWVVERIWQPAQPASTDEMERINTAMWQFAFNQIYGVEHADVRSLDQSARDLPEGTGDAFADAANLLLAYPAERLDHVGAFDFVAGLLDRGWPRPTTIFLRDIFALVHACTPGTFSAHANPYHATHSSAGE